MIQNPEDRGMVEQALLLLQSSSCFRGDVCASLPCACAESLAALSPAPQRSDNPSRLGLCPLCMSANAERYRIGFELCLVGGNHLANDLIPKIGADFATKYPPDMDQGNALLQLGAYYDIWACWAALMRARAVVNGQHVPTREG